MKNLFLTFFLKYNYFIFNLDEDLPSFDPVKEKFLNWFNSTLAPALYFIDGIVAIVMVIYFFICIKGAANNPVKRKKYITACMITFAVLVTLPLIVTIFKLYTR